MMFSTLKDETKLFFNQLSIYEMKFTEAQLELLETFGSIHFKSNTISACICKCGTFIKEFKGNKFCPLCLEKIKGTALKIKDNYTFKYKKTYDFIVDGNDIILREGYPHYKIKDNGDNTFSLEILKMDKVEEKRITILPNGEHKYDNLLFDFVEELTRDRLVSFFKAFNQIVEPLYRIDINRRYFSFVSNYSISHIHVLLADDTARTVKQFFGPTFEIPYHLFNEKGGIASFLNTSSKKLKGIFGLPMAIVHTYKELFDNGNDFQTNQIRYHIKELVLSTKRLFKLTNNNVNLIIELLKLSDSDINNLFKGVTVGELENLVENENHNVAALFNYIKKQHAQFGLPLRDIVKLYSDYISMSNDMKVKYEKYPVQLELLHDIAVRDYEIVDDESYQEVFKIIYSEMNYEYKDMHKNFIFIRPNSIRDVVGEGRQLKHCIASYTPKIIKNESLIYFMRSLDYPEQSFITIEINPKDKHVIEARGMNNRFVTNEEKDLIKVWALKNNLKFSL